MRIGFFYRLLILLPVVPGVVLAQEAPAPTPPSPSEIRLRLPRAAAKLGDGHSVLTPIGDGELIVGRVFVEVGDHYVIMLPDGAVMSVPKRETTATDRPFEPLSKQDLAERLTTKDFPGFKSRTTRRYVYVYNSSEAFVKATGRILETMYPGLVSYCKKTKLDLTEPEFPLVVVIFKTEKEFREHAQVPENVAAYYSGVSNSVLMYEQSDLAAVAPELAMKQSISTIAHEGVHQILHNIGVQQRLSRWPIWISEGLPEFFAPTEVGKRVRWKGVGLVNDLRLHSLKRRLDSGRLKQLIKPTVSAERLDANGYARSWAVVHFLAKRQRKGFAELLQQVSKLGPLESPMSGEELFEAHFGDDYSRLDQQVLQHLQGLPYVDPVANQTHYVAMVRNGLSRTTLVSPSIQAIQEFQQRTTGQFSVRAFPNKVAADRFADAWRRGG